MSVKLKQLKERKADAVKQLRAAHDALSAAPGDEAKKKDFDERSKAIESLNEEIDREERVSALEIANPDKRTAPGGTKPEDNILEDLRSKEPDNPILDPDKHGYSLMRAIRMRCGDEKEGGVEWEVHQELAKRKQDAGMTVRGLMVPHTLRMANNAEKRGTVINLSAGAGAIPTILAPTLIDVLRDAVVLRQLGAVILSDMVGAFAIPKKTAKIGFEWVAEDAAATATDITVGTVAFSEKCLTGRTRITRSFMKQSSLDAEAMVRQDLVDGMAVGMDNGGINGTGSSNQPTGLLAVSGTNTVAMGTNGLALTWAKVVEMETVVGTSNALRNSPAYLTNSKVRGSAKTVLKDSGSGRFLMENGEMNGYPVAVSTLVPSNLTKGTSSGVCSAAIFGDFTNLVFALWGGLDIIVDPFSESTKGNVLISAFQSADVNVRYAAAFSKCVDILA
ncbi:MAG: phage major capsid protein [Planctomyces sp.]|nr:phage major capsid protein [Planctomyces sp.]